MDTDQDDNSPFATALKVTRLISEAGYGLLPRQPTASMLEAGVTASGMTLEQVALIYSAMHRAGTLELGVAADDPIALVQKLLMAKQTH